MTFIPLRGADGIFSYAAMSHGLVVNEVHSHERRNRDPGSTSVYVKLEPAPVNGKCYNL